MEVLLQVGNIWKGWVMSPENILKKRVQGSRIISINLDGWPTFWLILMENVGKYTSPLDLLLHPCQAQIVFRSGAGLFIKKHPIMGEKGSVEQHQNWYVEVDGLPLQGADWIEKHVFLFQSGTVNKKSIENSCSNGPAGVWWFFFGCWKESFGTFHVQLIEITLATARLSVGCYGKMCFWKKEWLSFLYVYQKLESHGFVKTYLPNVCHFFWQNIESQTLNRAIWPVSF